MLVQCTLWAGREPMSRAGGLYGGRMRRSTPGVLCTEDLVDARADEEDPERVVAILEPLVTDARRARLREVIGRRLASVTAVLDRLYDPHNGAAVLRSCEAFAVQWLHVVERKGTLAGGRALGCARRGEVGRRGLPRRLWLSRRSGARAGPRARGDAPGRRARARRPGAHAEGRPRLRKRAGRNPRRALCRLCGAGQSADDGLRGEPERERYSGHPALFGDPRETAGDLDEPTRLRLYARGLCRSVAHAREILAVR